MDYIDIPYIFNNRTTVLNSEGVEIRFNMVIRKTSGGFEGAVRNTLLKSPVKVLTYAESTTKNIEYYQLLNGEPSNIWSANDDFTSFKKMSKVDLTDAALQEIAQQVIKYKMECNTLARSVRQVCTIETVKYYYSCPCNTPPPDGSPCISSCATTFSTTTCTLVNEGDYPPSGGGNNGNPNTPSPNQPPDTTKPAPCIQIQFNDSIAKDLLNGSYFTAEVNDTFRIAVDAFHNLIKQPFNRNERSMSLGYRATNDGTSFPKIQLGTTPINIGGPNHVETVFQDSIWNIIAGIHGHNDSANSAPSARDFYHFANANKENSEYRFEFVFAANGSRYVMTIADRTAFTNFIAAYPDSLNVNKKNNEWVASQPIGIEFNNTLRYLEKVLQYSTNDAYEKAFAYILAKYNTGVILSKADANGNFKGIFVSKDSSQTNINYNNVSVTPNCNY